MAFFNCFLKKNYWKITNSKIKLIFKLLVEWNEKAVAYLTTEIRKRTVNSAQIIYKTILNAVGRSRTENDLKRMIWFERMTIEVSKILFDNDRRQIGRTPLLNKMILLAKKVNGGFL